MYFCISFIFSKIRTYFFLHCVSPFLFFIVAFVIFAIISHICFEKYGVCSVYRLKYNFKHWTQCHFDYYFTFFQKTKSKKYCLFVPNMKVNLKTQFFFWKVKYHYLIGEKYNWKHFNLWKHWIQRLNNNII